MVPLVALVAVYVVDTLLHLDAVSKLLNTGVGFTVTVTLCILLQLFAVNVITYTTSTGDDVVFISVSVIAAVAPLPAALIIPATTARVHA